MQWWQILLLPFAALLDGIMRVRNMLYDRKIYRSGTFDVPVIAVGNLAIGGTGKTPMIDYLVGYFRQKDLSVVVLSRGYGRKTCGFRMATREDTPDSIGDEPYMYFRKYEGQLPVFVGEDRDLAIAELLTYVPETDIILLDDAFQHRKVTPSVHILLTTFENPFYQDFLLPAGRLREARKGARRADIILVTKCPGDLPVADRQRIKSRIGRYSAAEVFFMKLDYELPVAFFNTGLALHPAVVGISGTADPKPFETYLHRHFQVKLTHRYRDHYRYVPQDINDIVQELDDGTSLLTTEKDMVKLTFFPKLKSYSCYYVPIKMKFLADEALFLSRMEAYLKNCAQDGK